MKIDALMQRRLLDERQHQCKEAPSRSRFGYRSVSTPRPNPGDSRNEPRRKRPVRGFVVVKRQPDLANVARALHASSRLTSRLHCGQQQPDQDPDDRDHDQQFHQRERATTKTQRHKNLQANKEVHASVRFENRNAANICLAREQGLPLHLAGLAKLRISLSKDRRGVGFVK